MKNIISILILSLFVALVSCSLFENPVGPDEGTTLLDTTLNVSSRTAIVSLAEGITVSIPKGLTNEDFQLKIRTLDNNPGTPSIIRLIKAFDVDLSFADEFESPIKIRINFDPELIKEEKVKENFAAGYYNASENKWALYNSFVIDFDNNYIEFETTHLTTLGLLEFISTGGYNYKFTSQEGFTIYYILKGDDTPMSYSEYGQKDQSWHVPTGHDDWAPLYIQDIAHYLAEAKEAFADAPNHLTVPDGNVNVYVKNMTQGDGEYGSISGAIYIKNKMDLPAQLSGISYPDVLKATCAHEFMHLVQDYYYVMNKGSLGQWWLESTATQADRIVWGNSLKYSESEIYSIESNAALLESLGRSWDDCNNDPNWYLSGCFLQYLSTYREAGSLNIATAIKAGGSNSIKLTRLILNDELKSQLSTNIGKEYENYVKYLFTEGNENLSAFPLSKDFSAVETAPGLTKQLKMSKKSITETVTMKLPYLSTKLISVGNLESEKLKVAYEMIESNPSVNQYLCKVNTSEGKLEIIKELQSDDEGEMELNARSGGEFDSFVILLINTNMSEGEKTVKIAFRLSEDFEEFSYIKFELQDMDYIFKYTDGSTSDIYSIGFFNLDNKPNYRIIQKSFSNNKITIIAENTEDTKYIYHDYKSILTITGEYGAGEFKLLNVKEEITKLEEVWSDKESKWVDNTIQEIKEFAISDIPFKITDNIYGFKYIFNSSDEAALKKQITKMTHRVIIRDYEDKQISDYSLSNFNWDSVSFSFSCSMITM